MKRRLGNFSKYRRDFYLGVKSNEVDMAEWHARDGVGQGSEERQENAGLGLLTNTPEDGNSVVFCSKPLSKYKRY